MGKPTVSSSAAAWAARGLFALYILGTVATAALVPIGASDLAVSEALPIIFAFLVFAVVGLLVARRQPSNPLGWLFLALATGTALGNSTQGLGEHLLDEGRSKGLATFLTWFGSWLWPTSMLLILLIVLLYPTGRLPSPRWRPLLWVAGFGLTTLAASFAFKPGPLDAGGVANPFGIPGSEGFFSFAESVAGILLVGLLVATAAEIVVRARRSRGEERQQLKLFGYGALFMVVAIFGSNFLRGAGPVPDFIENIAFGLGVAAIPVSAGVAILKYRLYDIDLVINRTLVYVVLTMISAATYFVIVAGVSLFAAESKLTVAAATLAVAGLFQPLRRRVQDFIDRRFYRRKYDAGQTIEYFSARLRDEIDLNALTTELVDVVTRTMQPAHVSIWLRG